MTSHPKSLLIITHPLKSFSKSQTNTTPSTNFHVMNSFIPSHQNHITHTSTKCHWPPPSPQTLNFPSIFPKPTSSTLLPINSPFKSPHQLIIKFKKTMKNSPIHLNTNPRTTQQPKPKKMLSFFTLLHSLSTLYPSISLYPQKCISAYTLACEACSSQLKQLILVCYFSC